MLALHVSGVVNTGATKTATMVVSSSVVDDTQAMRALEQASNLGNMSMCVNVHAAMPLS